MSTHTEATASADAFDMLFERVKNSDDLMRLACKRCDHVFDGYKASDFKVHLRDHHPDLDHQSKKDLSVFLREECIRQLVHKPEGVTCLSCKSVLPSATGASIRHHFRVCQDHNIKSADADIEMNRLLTFTPVATGETDLEPYTDSQVHSTMGDDQSSNTADGSTLQFAFFCPYENCTFSTAHDVFRPESGRQNLYKHMRNMHGKGHLGFGQLKEWAFSTEPRAAAAAGKRSFVALDGRTDLDPPISGALSLDAEALQSSMDLYPYGEISQAGMEPDYSLGLDEASSEFNGNEDNFADDFAMSIPSTLKPLPSTGSQSKAKAKPPSSSPTPLPYSVYCINLRF